MANNASNGYSPDPDLFAFTKDLIRSAREEAKLSGASDGPAKELQPGATIDLGHRNIHELPDNVVELMKTEIERSEFYLLASTERPVDPMNLSHPQYRAVQPLCCYLARDHVSVDLQRRDADYIGTRLALAHNLLSSFPSSLASCSRLRYLNVRYNSFKEFPEEVCCIALKAKVCKAR